MSEMFLDKISSGPSLAKERKASVGYNEKEGLNTNIVSHC